MLIKKLNKTVIHTTVIRFRIRFMIQNKKFDIA